MSDVNGANKVYKQVHRGQREPLGNLLPHFQSVTKVEDDPIDSGTRLLAIALVVPFEREFFDAK